jgi:hypothetical protein
MQLNELFSQSLIGQDANTGDRINPNEPSDRYNSEDDETIMDTSDTRKVRLTLRQINKLRRLRESRALEKLQNLKKIQAQYGSSEESNDMSL